MRLLVAAALVTFAVGTAGCGGGGKHATSTTAPPRSQGTANAAIQQGLRRAANPLAAQFPAPNGRTLRALGNSAIGQANFGLSTSVITPGSNRLAFGLIGSDNHFLYGPTAVYVAPSPDAPAQGPYVAPIDSMITAPRFESKTVANDPLAIKGIYASTVRVSKPGVWTALALTKTPRGMVGSVVQFAVRRKDAIPAVGQTPPRIHTPTVASVHGNLSAIDTRLPHDDMHRVDFAGVIGRRPVVLLFATPQLCQSRVCGPVTDIELQMEHEFAGKAVFIHNEVYAQNSVNKGLRPQLLAFRLRTEPWLFTFDRRGRIAARVEGAFGLNAFRAAVRAALR
jgi:hypothetical protein